MSTPTITDEQLADLEREAMRKHNEPLEWFIYEPSYVLALISRLRAAERDAARYRWLREQEAEQGVDVLYVSGWERAATCWATTYPDSELLDAAIDAAMAQPEPNHPA